MACGVVSEKLRTLDHDRPWRDDQFRFHEAVIEPGHVEVAAGRPFVHGNVPDAHAYEHQGAVAVRETDGRAGAASDLTVQPFDHVVGADPPAVPRGVSFVK